MILRYHTINGFIGPNHKQRQYQRIELTVLTPKRRQRWRLSTDGRVMSFRVTDTNLPSEWYLDEITYS